MPEDQEKSYIPKEQLRSYKQRINFLTDTLKSTYEKLREQNLVTPSTEERYQGLIFKLSNDEELLEPELADALDAILAARAKEVQAFIDSA